MTSATKNQISRAQTERLLAWMKRHQPHVYAGLVRRFTPAGQVAGLWDSITGAASNVVNSVTNFFNSQGAQSLLTAAQPFLQNAIEKKQLSLNLQRIQAGLPVQTYQAPVPGTQVDPTLPFAPNSSTPPEIPWKWLGWGALGVAFLLGRRGR